MTNLYLENTTTPDKVLSFNSLTGKIEYTDKTNIATPLTVTGLKPTGNPIGSFNGNEIKETITILGNPTLTGNVISIPFTNELGILETKTLDLTTILVDVKIATIDYDIVSKKIKITSSDNTFVEIDVTDLFNPNQVADGATILGTGTIADPFRADKYLINKKYYNPSQALIIGDTIITHNLELITPFATIVQILDSTGSYVFAKIKNRTANTVTVTSNYATTVDITIF